MADIDQIIAGGAGASSRADFSGIGKLPEAYWKGRDEYAKNDLRDAFREGVPLGPDGQPDFGAMSKVLFQKGDIGQGVAAANLDLARQNLKFGQGQSADIANFESGGQPARAPLVSPPSANRSATAVVAPPLNKGGAAAPGGPQGGPQGAPQAPQGGATVMQVLSAQGIPNDQIGAASASVARQLGVDPSAPIDLNDPQVRNVLVPAVQQLKRMGIGQVAENPNAPPQAVPAPVTDRVATSGPPSTPSRADIAIAKYSAIMSDPRSPKQNVELAKTRLEALQKSTELTPDQKNYTQYKLEGGKEGFHDWMAETESKKTAATEDAKVNSKKYESLVESGVKAQQEIPQLEMLQKQMEDPNFYSGVGEKYNLLYKRLKSAAGIDPDASVPQEFLRKATAASVLASFGALKGLGPIRVAEMNLAKQAAAAPENSVPANKLLIEIQKRTYQRQGDIAELAQNYKEEHGVLDAGFDKKVTAYFRANPIFTDAEVNDFHKVIGEAPKTTAAAPGSSQKFSSVADVHAAIASGAIKKGDTFLDPNGTPRRVP